MVRRLSQVCFDAHSGVNAQKLHKTGAPHKFFFVSYFICKEFLTLQSEMIVQKEKKGE